MPNSVFVVSQKRKNAQPLWGRGLQQGLGDEIYYNSKGLGDSFTTCSLIIVCHYDIVFRQNNRLAMICHFDLIFGTIVAVVSYQFLACTLLIL